jgi:predicted O-linked N-acetylglucosamine transferase (SPINDLY family)
MAGFFEHHDREGFRLYAFSFGPNTADTYRQRIRGCFDAFIDIRELSDSQVKALCTEYQVDIAVDLKGFTQGARPSLFAQRCAPVQINYLGYPGTMGASFYDYIIADEVIIPPEYEKYYSEKVLRLPHCYQPNDRSRQVSDRVFTREELGLPKEGFVYCCFNNNYKILPETFDSWMRILKAVPGSVLWLLEDNAKASENLKKEAQSRGVDPGRLVFAPRMALPEHLARHKLADLFLDTFPYNAHTTASDALWVGLPLLTRMGKSFASRVAASISKAAGLTELTTASIQHYEELAVSLAQSSSLLLQIRHSLETSSRQTLLYDSESFMKNWSRLLEGVVSP